MDYTQVNIDLGLNSWFDEMKNELQLKNQQFSQLYGFDFQEDKPKVNSRFVWDQNYLRGQSN